MRTRRIYNFWVVNTSWCSERVIEWIEVNSTDAIFLDLPRDFESFLKHRLKLEVLKDRIDVQFGQHLSSLLPIIDFALSKGMPIYCYKDSIHSISESSTSSNLLTLVLKARLGRVDLDEWRKVIVSDLEKKIEYAEYEAGYIAERAKHQNVCLNLNEGIENFLVELGFDVKRIKFYSFNRPIDRIYSLIGKERQVGERKDSELKELIKTHVRFIDDVIEKGYEEACRIWE